MCLPLIFFFLDTTSPFKIQVEYSEHVMMQLQEAALSGDAEKLLAVVTTEKVEIQHLLEAVKKMAVDSNKGEAYKKTLLNAAKIIETASAAHVETAQLLMANPSDEELQNQMAGATKHLANAFGNLVAITRNPNATKSTVTFYSSVNNCSDAHTPFGLEVESLTSRVKNLMENAKKGEGSKIAMHLATSDKVSFFT